MLVATALLRVLQDLFLTVAAHNRPGAEAYRAATLALVRNSLTDARRTLLFVEPLVTNLAEREEP